MDAKLNLFWTGTLGRSAEPAESARLRSILKFDLILFGLSILKGEMHMSDRSHFRSSSSFARARFGLTLLFFFFSHLTRPVSSEQVQIMRICAARIQLIATIIECPRCLIRTGLSRAELDD